MASSQEPGAPRLTSGAAVPGTRYALVQRITGSHGGADTWVVRHEQGPNEYVMKLCPVGHPDRAELAVRAQRVEARLQAGFSHPNLAAVVDLGVTSEGQPFFVLERLTGRTLRAELARGAIPVPRALDLVRQLLEGINAAHGAGAIHRDIRPEQIFICSDGVVKVLGFGKILDVGAEGILTMTPARGRPGSPYAAPELAAGAGVDGRADVFSVGVLLYEIVAGRLPFAAQRTPATPVSPPSSVAAQLVPGELDAIVLKAMSVDPSDRQPTAGALQQDVSRLLERISLQSGALAPPDPGKDVPTKWARAPGGKRELPAVGDTAVFSLAPGESTARENVYTIASGTLLAGKYKVVRIIGKGGMGLVVEARHIHLDTRVAMKFLLPEFMSYTEASGRFLREARAASRLTSHHVARVLDVGTLDGGEPYMVMEYLAGEDLAYHAHAQTPLSIGEAIEYITQACDAIAEAHTLGIVHRDLKPANLFLTRRPDGRPLVKVLDFGISKVVGESAGDVALTQTTTILGSALYMSPEQMQSAKNVDQRTDVYALGVCLFELLGREQPWFAESFPELCAKVFTSPPKSLRSLRPDVPEGLEQAIERALVREPDKRYQNVSELVQAVSPYARLDTRSRMEGLLRQHGPLMRLLPPAPMATTVAIGGSRGAKPPDEMARPARSAASMPPSEPAPRSRWPLVLAVAAVVGGAALAWTTVGPAGAPAATTAPAASAPAALPAAPTATLEPAPSAIAPAVPESSASSTAAPAPSLAPSAQVATSAPASSRPVTAAALDRRPREPPAIDPPPSRAPTQTPPALSPELVQETCKMKLPDGTEKVVPCP